jgi:hypothetical protein
VHHLKRILAAAVRALAGAATVLHREIPAWPPRDHDKATGCTCHWTDEYLITVLRDDCPLAEHREALNLERTVGLA